jgi:hypothetical protein
MESNTPDNNDPGFVKKTIEQPMLNSDLRAKINGMQVEEEMSFFKANKFYFVAIFAGLLIISFLAYLAFKKTPQPILKEANVELKIDAPESVSGGSELIYKINISNNDQSKLVSLNLELVYPENSSYISSVPKAENISGTSFLVPDLIPGQNASVIVKSKISGNVNDLKELVARLHYKYSNFNSEFIKERAVQTRLTASNVGLQLSGLTSATNGQALTYILKYQNNSGAEIKNARVQLNYPAGFVFSLTDPAASIGNNIWNITSLPDKAEGSIEIRGSFSSSLPGESKTLSADFSILGSDGQFFVQNSANFITAMSNVPLSASQELQNGQTVVNPGDNVNVKIKYQNSGNIPASGVNIIVNLDSKAIDFSTIKAEGAQINNASIIWNAASVPQLQSLSPNENGEVNFSFQVKNPATKDSTKNLQIISSVKIKSNEYDFFPGSDLVLKIASPAKLTKTLNFSSGQLPPKVGQQSVFTISLSLNNSSNDFSDGILTAFIAGSGFDVNSVNAAEAGNVQYDSSTSKLSWKVGNLPAYTGKFSQARILQFKVKLVPALAQVGQSPELVRNITFSAKDIFTEGTINLKVDNVATSDYQDSNGYSQGLVGE